LELADARRARARCRGFQIPFPGANERSRGPENTQYSARGDDRNRTGVKGFAGPRVSHSATSPGASKVSGATARPQLGAGLYSGPPADVAQLARASACHAEGR